MLGLPEQPSGNCGAAGVALDDVGHVLPAPGAAQRARRRPRVDRVVGERVGRGDVARAPAARARRRGRCPRRRRREAPRRSRRGARAARADRAMLQVWPQGSGGSTRRVRACGADEQSRLVGSGRVAPWTTAPGCAARPRAQRARSQSAGGRQSSSVKATSGARAARQPALRWRGGPGPGAKRQVAQHAGARERVRRAAAPRSRRRRVVGDDDLEALARERLLLERVEQPAQPQRAVVRRRRRRSIFHTGGAAKIRPRPGHQRLGVAPVPLDGPARPSSSSTCGSQPVTLAQLGRVDVLAVDLAVPACPSPRMSGSTSVPASRQMQLDDLAHRRAARPPPALNASPRAPPSPSSASAIAR